MLSSLNKTKPYILVSVSVTVSAHFIIRACHAQCQPAAQCLETTELGIHMHATVGVYSINIASSMYTRAR